MKKKYFKIITIFVLLLTFSATGFSQNRAGLWTKTSKERLVNAKLAERKAVPNDAQYFQLNLELLKQQLASAPDRNLSTQPSSVIINFPDADGNLEAFRIMEASILAPELQRQVPQIRSYIGVSIENPGTVIRFSVTPQGLHTITLSTEKGTQYIDPYTTNSNAYLVYARKNLPVESRSFECEFEDDGLQADFSNVDEVEFRNANDGKLRNFRLALACTIEYAEFHWTAAGLTAATPVPQRKNAVLAAMNVTMTRVNAVYERELSVTMTIIPNNLDLVNITSDTYTNDNGAAMLTQNQTAIDGTIGSANYDIGHVFSTGGGGIANLNSPCRAGFKARGVTGLPQPVGDIFDYEYVAHEMGHQYGSPHTFNTNQANCGPQRSSADAYEPGSGSTIMAYAGLCGAENVQGFTDIYFHQRSLFRMWTNITNGNSQCGDETDTGNSAPVANAGVDYIIPRFTPYRLTGSATDADGEGTLTYTWEQYDLGPAGSPAESNPTGPLVRSFEGTSNPTRYIPNLRDLMNSNGSTDWEKLAGTARNLNFQLTVRDNDPRGGQTDSDGMIVQTAPTTGPFVVTSQTAANSIVWTPGETETITWNVGGTTGNGINTANVNILLSTDEGQTFDTVLASNVPNDGSHDIMVPNVSAPYCRVMVEGAGNIFFAVNQEYFAVGNYTYGPIDQCTDYTFNADLELAENSQTFQGFILTINDSRTISDLNVSVDVTTTNNAELAMAIRGPFGDQTNLHFLQSGSNNGCPGLPDALVTWDDEGMPNACTSTNTNLSIQPLEPMSFADGEDSQGDWIFNIGDVIVDGNRATWNSTTITICESGTGPILSVDDVSLEDNFSVYPNPNNGEFSIKLKSTSGKNINVEIYDIRGRSILNESYRNTGDFNQTISLDNAQSGMYLLNINDGDKKLTKKIIVN